MLLNLPGNTSWLKHGVCGLIAMLSGSASATVLLQDNFALGPRANANGNINVVNIGTALNGKQAQVPGTPAASWLTSAAPSWAFSATSPDPFEAPGTSTGSVTYNIGDENPPRPSAATALLGFAAPAGSVEESLDVVANVRTNITIGFTSSNTPTLDNFDSFGQLTLTLSAPFGLGGGGLWTLRTNGHQGGILSGAIQLQGFNRLSLRYDPSAAMVEGLINGMSLGSLSYRASSIAAVGFAGNGTVDNFAVQTLSPAGVPEPATWALLIGGFGAAGVVVRRRKREGLSPETGPQESHRRDEQTATSWQGAA